MCETIFIEITSEEKSFFFDYSRSQSVCSICHFSHRTRTHTYEILSINSTAHLFYIICFIYLYLIHNQSLDWVLLNSRKNSEIEKRSEKEKIRHRWNSNPFKRLYSTFAIHWLSLIVARAIFVDASLSWLSYTHTHTPTEKKERKNWIKKKRSDNPMKWQSSSSSLMFWNYAQ